MVLASGLQVLLFFYIIFPRFVAVYDIRLYFLFWLRFWGFAVIVAAFLTRFEIVYLLLAVVEFFVLLKSKDNIVASGSQIYELPAYL